ncbi:hypothetical protein L7F22_033283 [Adiantum nelumboides]|nr:hypothetical protein [Adiantum nelumboides]
MSFNKSIRSPSSRRRPSSPSSNSKKRHHSEQPTDRKMRSLQSLQERLCFTLKRSRTRRHNRGGGPNFPLKEYSYEGFKQTRFLRLAGDKSTLMESGLIQIPHLQCEYYESPSPLSISSCLSQESVATTAASATSSGSASSTISQVWASFSPISPLEYTSSDEGFSCDEDVMSLVSCCPDMVMHNVLDFMSPRCLDMTGEARTAPFATGGCPPSAGMLEERGATVAAASRPPSTGILCELEVAIPDQANCDCPTSVVEDDGEPYRIDLCDFEPDANAVLNSPPQENSHHHQKSYGGGALCLRLDYEEVLRAWKERGECLISREPIYYPSPYLDPLHKIGCVPHPPFF